MPEKVLIALSGGVDSALAAALLKQAGYDVVGVTMQICACDTEAVDKYARCGCYGSFKADDIADARRVAQYLGIPFHVIDLCREYETEVLTEVISGYSHGLTPNPCIYCNPRIKFGALAQLAQEAGLQFGQIATGHYAKVEYEASCERYLLKKGVDAQKDQSYFLSFLRQEQLGLAIFPLGCYSKPQVRRMAGEMGLPVSNKPESQDFVSGGYHALLDGIGQPGMVVDGYGREIGTHNGIAHYTIGQHKGLNLSVREKLFVTKISPETNTIVVGAESELWRRECLVRCINWIAIDSLSDALRADVKIRSKAELAVATIEPKGDGVLVVFDTPQKSISPGQAAVFYRGDVVLGAGIIDALTHQP